MFAGICRVFMASWRYLRWFSVFRGYFKIFGGSLGNFRGYLRGVRSMEFLLYNLVVKNLERQVFWLPSPLGW